MHAIFANFFFFFRFEIFISPDTVYIGVPVYINTIVRIYPIFFFPEFAHRGEGKKKKKERRASLEQREKFRKWNGEKQR